MPENLIFLKALAKGQGGLEPDILAGKGMKPMADAHGRGGGVKPVCVAVIRMVWRGKPARDALHKRHTSNIVIAAEALHGFRSSAKAKTSQQGSGVSKASLIVIASEAKQSRALAEPMAMDRHGPCGPRDDGFPQGLEMAGGQAPFIDGAGGQFSMWWNALRFSTLHRVGYRALALPAW